MDGRLPLRVRSPFQSFPSSLALGLVVAWFAVGPAGAIPNAFFGNGRFSGPVIPAQPRFNADLTAPFLDPAAWEQGALPGPWTDPRPDGDDVMRTMTALPVLFGEVPMAVAARAPDGKVRDVSITFLDAGPFFGYNPGGEDSGIERAAGEARRQEFAAHFQRLARDLRERLAAGCGPPRLVSAGRSRLLRQTYLDHEWNGFVLRLVVRPEHSVELRLFRGAPPPATLLRPEFASLDARERRARCQDRVRAAESGALFLDGIPRTEQGLTPHCAVHALALGGGYLGLGLGPGDLAAAAGFRNTGSARGSRVQALHGAVAEELGMHVAVSSRFDPDRVRKGLETGLPVIVWRRVSVERELARTRDPASLPADPSAWPDRSASGSPSHASLVTGWSPATDEVFLTEPWGDAARHRPIPVAELEATVYAVFHFRWRDLP
jgi:hypothetical protein